MKKKVIFGYMGRLLATDSNFGDLPLRPLHRRVSKPIESVKSDTESIENLIYLPNEAGFPSSASSIELLRDRNPEIAAFVQQTLRCTDRSKDGVPDGDYALECMRERVFDENLRCWRDEYDTEYADRLKSLASNAS